MFVTADQPRAVVLLFVAGAAAGVFYELFYFIKLFFKGAVLKSVLNAAWCAFSSILFVHVNCECDLGDFRLYKAVIFFTGALFYYLSAHKIVAFFELKAYNIFVKVFKRFSCVASERKNARKVEYVGSKKKKNIYGNSFGRSSVVVYNGSDSMLSTDGGFRKKKRNSGLRSAHRLS